MADKKSISKRLHSAAIGGGVNSHFFKRHFVVITLLVTLCLMFISVRFDCITAMETINKLKEELNVTRTKTQSERAKYMSSTSESTMQQMVDSLHLGLAVQDCPPFIIEH